MKRDFRGVFTALITPFAKNGNVDEDAFERLIDFQIAQGVDGLVPCGTTGESPTLSHNEHDRVIEMTVEFSQGKVPVIAGTGSNATSEAVRLSVHAQEAGVDAVLLVNPYYNKPTQKGLYLHFKAIADALTIPCIVYNIQGRTAVNIETDTLVQLMTDCSNITVVKEASGNLDQMKEVIRRRHENFSVLSGDDNMCLSLIEAGGDGVISVASNLLPKMMVEMVHTALEGNITDARRLEKRLKPFFEACFVETNPIPIKTAMAAKGWCEEVFRLPLCTLSTEENRKIIMNALESLGLK
ncbi:MAG: 4-hydroxy-tetrahydrodipicolinate synthase [Spirochaetales bacterium]|nr:4-hydroxy-tetrahydrodipicolinate synthase [Spirochaetales bacterium]